LTDVLPSPSGRKHGYTFTREEFFSRVQQRMGITDLDQIKAGEIVDFRRIALEAASDISPIESQLTELNARIRKQWRLYYYYNELISRHGNQFALSDIPVYSRPDPITQAETGVGLSGAGVAFAQLAKETATHAKSPALNASGNVLSGAGALVGGYQLGTAIVENDPAKGVQSGAGLGLTFIAVGVPPTAPFIAGGGGVLWGQEQLQKRVIIRQEHAYRRAVREQAWERLKAVREELDLLIEEERHLRGQP